MTKIQYQRSFVLKAIVVAFLCVFNMNCGRKTEPSQGAQNLNEKQAVARIIPLAPNLAEIVFELGLDNEIVGVTKYSAYLPEASGKPNVGTFWQPDIEAVLALKPTLVITLGFKQQMVLAERLKKIGCEVLTVDIETVDQLHQSILTIGEKIDKVPEAEKMIERLQDKQLQIASRHSDAERPKVLWVIQREPLRVAGTKTYVNELIGIVGGVNAVGDTLQVYPPISTEEVIRSMPDVIIEPADDPRWLESRKATAREFYQRFASVPAVRQNRIYIINGDLVSRLGPRLDEGMELVETCVWPQKEQP